MLITNVEMKMTKAGKPYKAVSLDDNRKFNVFQFHSRYDEIEIGLKIEDTEIEKDGEYWSLKDANQERKTNFKTQGMKEMQESKAQNISAAQDRNEAMHAKNNASLLVANHPSFRDLNTEQVLKKVLELAAEIQNSELRPF